MILRAGPPHVLNAGTLSAAAMVSSAALTNRIDQLVARGLVDRVVDPEHRRRVLISLTTTGLALIQQLVEHHVANERRLLEGIPIADREELARLLRRLLVSLGDRADDAAIER